MKKSNRDRTKLKNRPQVLRQKKHQSTLERGALIIGLVEAGYSFELMGQLLGVSKQRVYQYVQQCNLQEIVSRMYQNRLAKTRFAKMKAKRMRVCARCNKSFFMTKIIGKHVKYCSDRCFDSVRRKQMLRSNRNARTYNKESILKKKAMEYIRAEKRKLDNIS